MMLHYVKMTTNSWKAILVTLMCLTFGALYAVPGMAVTLKHESIVTQDSIALGDIFDGLSRDTDKIVGAAPAPGEEMTLNARTLLRLALALDISWRPQTSQEQIIIRREGVKIGADEMRSALLESIVSKGGPAKAEIVITSGGAPISLPQDAAGALTVRQMKIAKDGKSFEAELAAPAERPVITRAVRGLIEPLVDVPVLTETINRGTIIGMNDLQFVERRARDIGPDTILNAKSLVGSTPRRLMAAGSMLKPVDIEAPRIVERGQDVTLIFSAGALSLTAKGKVLENGTRGDTIRVLNATSNKTVSGQVTAEQEVTVAAY